MTTTDRDRAIANFESILDDLIQIGSEEQLNSDPYTMGIGYGRNTTAKFVKQKFQELKDQL